ncbi:hypothetical protein R6Q59_024058 [Mikania micrantha]
MGAAPNLQGGYAIDNNPQKLLCIHAFDSQNPKEGYEEVSEKLVKYCDGHPLAIEVLGSSLQNHDVAYWEECIKILIFFISTLKLSFNNSSPSMVILTEPLPSSSSSSTHDHDQNRTYEYDVFLSFRGADTRNAFTDHLYNALRDAGINTFLDDEEIETGKPLKPKLKSAIRSSRASIIILSKNYATSTWCLDELVLILHQKRICKQYVIPIFYHVEPTHVRKQLNSFGEAMAEHKQKMDSETNEEKRSQLARKMESWKKALTEIAALKGENVKNRKEAEFIKKVVADIHRRLRVPLSNTLPLLIGMDYQIEFISSWLRDGSCNSAADILTVVGMGGIGKTSLAKYAFQLHSNKFHKSSFIEGIDAKCKENLNGMLDLQKQLLGDISKSLPLHIHDVSVYASKIKNALARKKTLLVLDDIGCLEQLDVLLGNEAFHQGSKIIITTKDASLTERCALFDLPVQPKHKKVSLNGLYRYESLELLCIHAFKSNKPEEGYNEVSEKLVKYCQGHPLALEVLGRSLQKRDVGYWEECIKVLRKEPDSRINKALKMSFDALLSKNDKELFKHIACFFVGIDRDVTETILNSCDLNARYGITNLIERCLLSTSWNNKLKMHSLIQEMGRDLDKENLLGLALDMRMLDKKKAHKLGTNSLSRMDNLMLLKLNYVQLNECFQSFPNELRWLCTHGFPLKSIDLDITMENLVVLDMSYSNIESFGTSYNNPQPPVKRQKGLIGSSSNENRLLRSLKILDLSFCEQLHSVGGFFLLPILERLILRNCTSLIEVCESIEQCDDLVHVDLSYCHKLRKLPKSLGKLSKVKTLLLDGCNFGESHNEMRNAKAIPSDLKFIMISLPSSLRKLSLADNNLSNECFPMDFSCLAMLKELCLDNNPIVSMPSCVRTLTRLEILHMRCCYKMISIENPPRTLLYLCLHSGHYNSTKKIKFDSEMRPLLFDGIHPLLSTLEIDGMLKTQGMTSVEEKVLSSLGWTNLDFTKESHFDPEFGQPQMHYEFGIFSTFYQGKEMPEWINCRSKGPSISFTIPSSCNNLQGLNFCCVEERLNPIDDFPFDGYWIDVYIPYIIISNITKNHTWIYQNHIRAIFKYSEDIKSYLNYLSQWMFGPNEMEAGDHIAISVKHSDSPKNQLTFECGIGLVYDEDGKNEEEEKEEDVLSYYKSWNHIIGGDLSPFQTTNGEYILNHGLHYEYDVFWSYGPWK